MSRYVAFMRAINVGGHAVVRMPDLAAMFTAAGCRNVMTFIQSGNVLFDSSERGIPAILRALRGRLRERLGDEPDVILRTADDLEAILTRDPFRKVRADPRAKVYVVFLSQPAQHAARLSLLADKEALDLINVDGKDVIVVSRPKKNGKYAFPNAVLEKELGVSATTRNWNTVMKIAALGRKADAPSGI